MLYRLFFLWIAIISSILVNGEINENSYRSFEQFALSKGVSEARKDALLILFDRFLNQLTSDEHPFLIAVGGAPGSGKTTYREHFLQIPNTYVHDMDEVMRCLPGYAIYENEFGHREAYRQWLSCAKEMTQLLTEFALQSNYSIVYDRTLCSEDAYNNLSNAKQRGYYVHLVGLYVDKNTAIERIKRRESKNKKGMIWLGSDTLNQYRKRFSQLWGGYLSFVDEACLYSTQNDQLELVYSLKEGVVNPVVYRQFLEESAQEPVFKH